MNLYSNVITESDVRNAFRLARERNGADIWIDDIDSFTPRRRGFSKGVKFYAQSMTGKRPTGHRAIGSYPLDDVPRAASWDAYGYVIAHLFNIDPSAVIGWYEGRSDFRAKVIAAHYRKEPRNFLDVLERDNG